MGRTDWLFAGLGTLWLCGFLVMAAGGPQAGATASTSSESAGMETSRDAIDVADLSLAQVAREGDVEALRALIAQGADVDGRESDETTPLHWAVYENEADAVDALIAADADVQAVSREGATPLSLAALNGDARVIAALLDAGADVNERLGNGETPLMMAARTGSVEAIDLLLDRGAEIDATEELRGTTALMWAAANRNPAAVGRLLERGADHAMTSGPGTLGRRPYLADTAKDRIRDFHLGVGQAGQSIAVNLEADGENLEVSSLADTQQVEAVREASQTIDDSVSQEDRSSRGGGLTALVFATREGDMDAVRTLVEGGADVNQTTNYGWTALLTAVQNRYYRIATYLMENGADPNIANDGGWTPLYIATDNRNIEGGDYPVRRPDMDHMELIELLLDNGADPNLRMASSTETRTIFTHQWLHEEGATPFLRAAQSGDLELLELLLEHGADPAIATVDNVTPLQVASGIGWVEGVTHEWSPEQTLEVVQLLIDLGADVNEQDTMDERTALMGAAHKGRSDVIQLLYDNGADLTIRDYGSRDSIHQLYGTRWNALDYAEGLVRVGVQSAQENPEAAALLRRLMREEGLEVPPEGRTLDSICVVSVCQPPT